MEDQHIIALNQGPDGNTHIFGVCDGHGGVEVAKYIKNHFVEIFLSDPLYKSGMITMALKETYKKINENLRTQEAYKELTKYHLEFKKEFNKQLSEENLKEYQSKGFIENLAYEIGSTCNVVVIHNNEFFYANCGDSRSILLRHGEACPMSTDHKPELPNEFKRIRRSGSIIKEGRVNGILNMSRSIGDLQFKRGRSVGDFAVSCVPDVMNEAISDFDDFIIIACDGIWESITNEKMANYVYNKVNNGENNFEKILEELFIKAVAKDGESETGTDNMTCILIQLKKNQK